MAKRYIRLYGLKEFKEQNEIGMEDFEFIELSKAHWRKTSSLLSFEALVIFEKIEIPTALDSNARRQAFRQLAAKIAALSEAQRQEIVKRAGAVITCEGHALSFFNTCLLVHQREHVSVFGGYQQWKHAGRQVKKGEHGLQIWISIKGTKDETPSV
jgi:hypothetical protein